MPAWFATHFLNSALAWSAAAAAIIAAPIIIHLINRLRYKRVRFAAMEFLLASQQKNRRRVLLEQLLLLLCRIAIMVLIVMLIGRFTANATALSLFQDAQSHHVILLDDSGSMLDRDGEKSAFDAAKELVKKLAISGASRTGESQKFTLILLSTPEQSLAGLTQRNFDDNLPSELADFLDNTECSLQRGEMSKGIEAVRRRLISDKAASRHLHVISDFRENDWVGDNAIVSALKELDEAGVGINLVKTVTGTHENLAVVALDGDLQAAAEGVLTQFHATVANLGTTEAKDVPVKISLDGTQLPLTERLASVPAGEEGKLSFWVIPNGKRLDVSVGLDSLDQDNIRHLGLDVPPQIPVLIIDATPELMQGNYIADALAANPKLTGIAVVVEGPDYLSRFPIDNFQSIFLVNIPQLREDAVVALEKYAANGGGIAWFLGDLVQPKFYNERLYMAGEGLFPVQLATRYEEVPHDDTQSRPDDILASRPVHPIFNFIADKTSILNYVIMNAWIPVDAAWWAEGTGRPSTLQTLASAKNKLPVVMEHRYGEKKARMLTFLTSAGPLPLPESRPGDPIRYWNNWATGDAVNQGFAVVMLELQAYIARKDRIPPQRPVGEPIELTFSLSDYQNTIEIERPDGRTAEIQAGPWSAADVAAESKAAQQGENAANSSAPIEPSGKTTVSDTTKPATATAEAGSEDLLRATYRETDLPGVYRVQMRKQDGTLENRLFAFNVPVEESQLQLATNAQLTKQLGETENIEIREPETTDWFRSSSPGNEMRTPLIIALLLMLIIEQYLAYRFSYHPRRVAPVPA